jgi:hypothetical protein
VVTANMDFYSGSNRAYLEHLADGADVLMLQEVKDFWVADVLPEGWKVCQDTTSDAKAGAAVAYRAETVTLDGWFLVRGCDAPKGGGMLPRWIVVADLDHDGGGLFTAISAHAPPPRYAELQPEFTAQVAHVVAQSRAPVVGADANMDIDKFARALGPGMKAYGKQSGICLVTASPLTDVEQDHYGESEGWTDHPAVGGTLT